MYSALLFVVQIWLFNFITYPILMWFNNALIFNSATIRDAFRTIRYEMPSVNLSQNWQMLPTKRFMSCRLNTTLEFQAVIISTWSGILRGNSSRMSAVERALRWCYRTRLPKWVCAIRSTQSYRFTIHISKSILTMNWLCILLKLVCV